MEAYFNFRVSKRPRKGWMDTMPGLRIAAQHKEDKLMSNEKPNNLPEI